LHSVRSSQSFLLKKTLRLFGDNPFIVPKKKHEFFPSKNTLGTSKYRWLANRWPKLYKLANFLHFNLPAYEETWPNPQTAVMLFVNACEG